MDELNSVKVSEDGECVTIGVGTLSKKAIHDLWDAGKQTGWFRQVLIFLHARPAYSCSCRHYCIQLIAGQQTVTGCCECTSFTGPALGGGHGWLQGRHGLIADQFLSMNIVFANGSLQTIDKTTDPDLWCAMQGAGHNFGIVISVKSKAYDIEFRDWAYKMFTFNSDKVEEFYTAINVHLNKNGTQPVDIIN
jgi:hypothetical protein